MQRILVFQQDGSGAGKIQGIKLFGGGHFQLKTIAATADLPLVVENPEDFLPAEIDADLVLDFLWHPDLSNELAHICSQRDIPVVASGKKWRLPQVECPPV